MTMAAEYLELATRYERAAKKSTDPGTRQQLLDFAGTYNMLAKSDQVLTRSEDHLERLKQRPCKK